MGVEYPKDFKSDYPVVLRKAAKLAVALYYDFLENENENYDDVEWVPHSVEVSQSRVAEDDDGNEIPEKRLIMMTVGDVSIELWFDNDELDAELLIEEFTNDSLDLNERNLTAWVEAVEEVISAKSEARRLSNLYSDGTLPEELEV